nr:MAG TPA: hypothetical protein [Caudoviricetes sp.]
MALHEVQLKGYSVRPGNLSLGTFDSYGIEQLHVTADDSWDGLDILAVFHAPNGDAKKVVVGADGMLNVPPEATAKQAGNGRIVFVGLAENVQRITVDMGYNIKPHSDIEGDNPGVPTPDVVQQILQAALNAEQNSAEAKSVADGLRNDAANGKFNGKDGAKGDNGDDGTTPQLKIGEDNLWHVSYDNGATWVSLGVKATGDAGKDGADGVTPHIGENGNWWVGETDTGVSAKGPKGDPGPDNLVIITATASATVQGEYIPDTAYTKALTNIQANKAVMIKLEDVPGRYYIPYSSSNAEILASAGTVSGSKQSIELYLLKWTASNNTITITGTKEGCIADGGTTGQVLVKKSDESFDTEWKIQYKIVNLEQPFSTADLIELYKNGTLIYVYTEDNKRLYNMYYTNGQVLNGISEMSYSSDTNILLAFKCRFNNDNTFIIYTEKGFCMPKGGLTNQILAKKSNTDGDTEWINPPSGEIPEDYPQIREDVSQLKEDTAALKKRQNVLVGSETGNPASCNDAFAAPLCGLTVYGKSTQDGTPTPDVPVPIVSAGDSGSVVVKVSDGNGKEQTLTLPTPNGLHGISVPAGGNYTDQNGQQWVCDEVDLEKGVRVQRVTTIVFSDGTKFTLRTTSTSTKFRFSTAVDGLKTANLTTADSSAFCSALALGKQGSTWTIPNTFTIDADGRLYVRFENINSLDELQQYLQRTPMSLTAILATPIETPLSPAEIAAYKALTAYAPDTVVQASDGAGIKLDYQRDVNLVVKNLEDAIASMTTTT